VQACNVNLKGGRVIKSGVNYLHSLLMVNVIPFSENCFSSEEGGFLNKISKTKIPILSLTQQTSSA
jgi:hypothetical protein